LASRMQSTPSLAFLANPRLCSTPTRSNPSCLGPGACILCNKPVGRRALAGVAKGYHRSHGPLLPMWLFTPEGDKSKWDHASKPSSDTAALPTLRKEPVPVSQIPFQSHPHGTADHRVPPV
jgi:hypothetical protein